MATRSRARMFHATARALRTAADQRLDDTGHTYLADTDEMQAYEEALEIDAPSLAVGEPAIDQESLRRLHHEYRWAESKLAQASERLAEAQEARRKDLVALACMRRELRASFESERAYVRGQLRLFADVVPKLRARELELAELVTAGAPTAAVIRDLAAVRAERKFYDLAMIQSGTQIARIDDSEATLEYEVANEAYDRSPDGNTMRELARLRTAQTRMHRAAVRARNEAGAVLAEVGVDRTSGEVTAVGSFLAAEFEGDARAHQRMERLRARQVELEAAALPAPASPWKTGLLHPVSWIRARRVATAG